MRHEIEQNTEEWFSLRSGKITGSEASNLLVNKKGGNGFGVKAISYINTKIAEQLTYPDNGDYVDARQWGHDHEQEAREVYEQETWNTVKDGGFHSKGKYTGCSPDGDVEDTKGIIEIKCPKTSVKHYLTIKSGETPKEHLPQILHNTIETGSEWCDFISYDPRFINPKHRIFIKRVFLTDHKELVEILKQRTKMAIDIIELAVEEFNNEHR